MSRAQRVTGRAPARGVTVLTCQEGLRVEEARKPHHSREGKVVCPGLQFPASEDEVVKPVNRSEETGLLFSNLEVSQEDKVDSGEGWWKRGTHL